MRIEQLVRRARTCLLGVITVTLAACGSDSTGPVAAAHQLNAQEAQLVAAGLFQEMALALEDIDLSLTGGALGTSLSRRPPDALKFDAACRRGGRVAGSVTVSSDVDEDGTGTVRGNVSFTPQGCVVLAGERSLPVSGDPSLEYDFKMTFAEGEPSGDIVFKATGGFKWPDGKCTVDYTIALSQSGSGSITGKVCGQSVNGTV